MFSNSFNHSISSSSSVNNNKNDALAKFKRFLFKEKSKPIRNPVDLKLYSDYCSDSLVRKKQSHDDAFTRRGRNKTAFRSLRIPKSKTGGWNWSGWSDVRDGPEKMGKNGPTNGPTGPTADQPNILVQLVQFIIISSDNWSGWSNLPSVFVP